MADNTLIVDLGPQTKSDNPTEFRSLANMTADEILAQANNSARDALGSFTRKEENLSPREKALLDATAPPVAGQPDTRIKIVPRDGQFDPMARSQPVAQQPMTMSGIAQSAFAIGDRVYNSFKKKEGTVVDVALSGKIRVEYDDDTIGWALSENLAKLRPTSVKHRRR